MKKKITLFILIGLMLLCIGFGIWYFTKKNDITSNQQPENSTSQEVKKNTNQEMIKNQTVDGIAFTNIQCTFDGSYSLLEYTITNQTEDRITLDEYELIVKDKAGNILANLAPDLGVELKPQESYSTGNAIDIDLSDAYSMEIVIGE